MNSKIINLSALADILRSSGRDKKIVLCHGCFDLLHIGHIRYFQQAKTMGDILVVTLTPDRFVDKGPNRPAFSEGLRADAIASLGVVDYVALNEWPTAAETLELLKPNVYVKGADFKSADADTTGKLTAEADVCKRLGVELRFTDDVVFSSTNLINQFFSSFPEEVRGYLQLFRKRYSLDQILEYIGRMRSLKVLLAGDAIIDEYCYGSTLGTSSKYPTIALLHQSTDRFAGGVLAIANHLAGFCGAVELFTVLGDDPSHMDFIKGQLLPSVSAHFFTKPGAPTTLKRRFIEGYTFAKLLEVYEMDDSGLPGATELEMRRAIGKSMTETDMTLAADFGHGTISADLRKQFSESEAFLAVNTQANAGNRQFHTISHYGRADFVSISGGELLLDRRARGANIRALAMEAAARHKSKLFVATLGKQGACGATQDGAFVETPAFVSRAVDTIGSGDAFLAISALAVRLGIPHEASVFLGNAAGALAVQTVGNQTPVTRPNLEKFITSMLK
jgi:rfaE bifunctional protein nucleotidyltransferase chain/domain